MKLINKLFLFKIRYKVKVSLILFLTINCLYSQINEIGVFIGGSNFVGDIGSTNYIAPNETAFGLIYKWNKSPRYSWRFSFIHSSLTAKDSNADTAMRVERNYDFKNKISELSAGMEFNFFEFNLHENETIITPYIYSGLSLITFWELYHVNGYQKKDYYDYNFAIPIVIGIKTNITKHFVLGIETGTRYVFSDNLDGSNPKNINLKYLKFGNTKSNDWVTFTGFTLTYTFGQKPCYCNY